MIWEFDVGLPPGEKPEMYWRPNLGHWCSLRPCDVGDLTPGQLWAALDAIKEVGKK